MSEVKLSLVRKLSEVMAEMKRVPKNGYNAFHKYKYATESDVSEVVREELAKRHVMMIPSVREQSIREHKNARGNTEYIAKVLMDFTFYDGESGEQIVFTSVGEGQDAGDKAVYKAMTGATKYAIMKAFLISTGDDPEADSKVDERNQQTAQKKQASHAQKAPSKASDELMNTVNNLVVIVAKKATEAGKEATTESVAKAFKVTANMTEQQANEALTKLKAQAEKLGGTQQ